jgi:hypothetical protein
MVHQKKALAKASAFRVFSGSKYTTFTIALSPRHYGLKVAVLRILARKGLANRENPILNKSEQKLFSIFFWRKTNSFFEGIAKIVHVIKTAFG